MTMHSALKVVFCIPLVINALFGVFILASSTWELITPSSPYHTVREGLIVLAASLTTLSLLAGAYYLAIVQERGSIGFALLVLSYVSWFVFLFVVLSFGNGRWN